MSIKTLLKGKYVAVAAILAVSVIVPFVAFGSTHTIVVDSGASGTQDGSSLHPYRSIGDALDHASDGDEVYIHDGTYEENITIPKGVTVKGNSKNRGKVVIDGNENKPTVTMKNGSELSFVTVKNGRNGIRVLSDAKAKLYDLLVTGAQRDGIFAESAPRDKDRRLYAEKIEVKKNGKAGIYSEKRYVVLVNSDIHDNDSDGIDFSAGTKAWLADVTSNDNAGSGWKAVVDGAEIWSRDNQFRRNGREGIQVESFGGAGKFGVKTSKMVDNGRYGIALLARNTAAGSMWKNIFFETNTSWGNTLGTVSSVIRSSN
ncbi:MAG: right-handed parallel beta-helix repeat-containing protein [Candidatus Moraniibacteriota bacterium]